MIEVWLGFYTAAAETSQEDIFAPNSKDLNNPRSIGQMWDGQSNEDRLHVLGVSETMNSFCSIQGWDIMIC